VGDDPVRNFTAHRYLTKSEMQVQGGAGSQEQVECQNVPYQLFWKKDCAATKTGAQKKRSQLTTASHNYQEGTNTDAKKFKKDDWGGGRVQTTYNSKREGVEKKMEKK